MFEDLKYWQSIFQDGYDAAESIAEADAYLQTIKPGRSGLTAIQCALLVDVVLDTEQDHAVENLPEDLLIAEALSLFIKSSGKLHYTPLLNINQIRQHLDTYRRTDEVDLVFFDETSGRITHKRETLTYPQPYSPDVALLNTLINDLDFLSFTQLSNQLDWVLNHMLLDVI